MLYLRDAEPLHPCSRAEKPESAIFYNLFRCLQQSNHKALFELNPVTGKTHQLRAHRQALGWPILNGKYYPQFQPLSADDYSAPLQLLVKQLQFIDPVTQHPRCFSYDGSLALE